MSSIKKLSSMDNMLANVQSKKSETFSESPKVQREVVVLRFVKLQRFCEDHHLAQFDESALRHRICEHTARAILAKNSVKTWSLLFPSIRHFWHTWNLFLVGQFATSSRTQRSNRCGMDLDPRHLDFPLIAAPDTS